MYPLDPGSASLAYGRGDEWERFAQGGRTIAGPATIAVLSALVCSGASERLTVDKPIRHVPMVSGETVELSGRS